jgi:hypothetical protein
LSACWLARCLGASRVFLLEEFNMGMTLQFSASDLARANLSAQWLNNFHLTGGGPEQSSAWLDAYCIVSDPECGDLYFSIFSVDNNPYCICGTSNTDMFCDVVMMRRRNGIPFSVF